MKSLFSGTGKIDLKEIPIAPLVKAMPIGICPQ
jgi:hypothetical protein